MRAVAAVRWPIAKGEVIESRIETQRAGANWNLAAVVRYKYTVGGQEFVGNRIKYFPKPHRWRSTANRDRSRYRKGEYVDVRYDVRRPADSVLEPGAPWTAYFAVAVFGLGFVLGLTTLVRVSLLAPR